MKSIIKTILPFTFLFLTLFISNAQETSVESTQQTENQIQQKDSVQPYVIQNETLSDSLKIAEIAKKVRDSVKPFQRIKVDGVAAVIGEYVILDSDIDIAYAQVLNEGVSAEDVTRCELAGSLFENKLYAHHAVQDSIEIADSEVDAMVDQQIAYMSQQLGTIDKVLKYYRKDNEEEFRKELFEINKTQRLAEKMRTKIIEAVEITPEEVKEFFNSIPEEERPLFGTELEIAQIVIEPKVPEEEEKKVIDRLNEFRTDILDNGSSFATKAVLYSQDPGSKSLGGKITLKRSDPFVKEFKDVAFSLQEGEISEPFKTMFGYHIIQLDRIRGQEIDVRHILLSPDVTSKTVKEAKALIDSVRTSISSGKVNFKEAAREFSDEKETKEDGGLLINPTTGDSRFELTKIDPILYDQVSKLKTNEVSLVISDQDRRGKKKFKIVTVLNRFDEHIADYSKDYLKIQELALKEKQIRAISKWQDEKIADTYIKVNGEYRDCEYSGNWLKKEQ